MVEGGNGKIARPGLRKGDVLIVWKLDPQTALSVGTGLLSAFMGRKAISTTSVSKAAVRQAGRLVATNPGCGTGQ